MRAGRPRLLRGQKRVVKVSVSFTEGEIENLDRVMRDKGMTRAALLRTLVNGAEMQFKSAELGGTFPGELRECLSEIAQILHKLYRGIVVKDAQVGNDQILRVLTQIYSTVKSLPEVEWSFSHDTQDI